MVMVACLYISKIRLFTSMHSSIDNDLGEEVRWRSFPCHREETGEQTKWLALGLSGNK